MRRQAKAPSTGSNEGIGNSRGLSRRAAATRGASSDARGTGARSSRRPASFLTVLSLALCALGIVAASVSAAPPILELGPATPAYVTADVTGTLDPADHDTGYFFQYSTDPVVEGWNSPISRYEGRTIPAGSGPTPVSDHLEGGGCDIPNCNVALKPGTTYVYRLVGINEEGEFLSAEGEFTTPPVAPPTILSAADATDITNNTGQVTAEVDRPAGEDPAFDVNCRYEYVADIQFDENEGNGLPGFEGATPIPCDQNPIKDPGMSPISAKLTGLAPRTTYHLRLVVSNAGGGDIQEVSNFTTTAVPTVKLVEAGNVQATSATLGGNVSSATSPVTYQFQWGELGGPGDETYENVAPANPEPLPFEDESFHFVTVPLVGLSPETDYHYRIVATNTLTAEEAVSEGRIFSTRPTPVTPPPCPNESSRVGPSAALPDCRAYEWVSPGLNSSFALTSGMKKVRPDGSALSFVTLDAVDDAETNEVTQNMNIARRDSGRWTVKSITPFAPASEVSYFPTGFKGVSEDLSQSLVASVQPLAGPTSPGGGANFYLHRADGSFVALTNIASGGLPTHEDCCEASRDFTHIFYYSPAKQLEADPAVGNLYQWANGDLTLVAVLPNEELAPNGGKLASGALPAMSDNGSQVLFKANGYPGLYLRTDGESTVEASATQRSVDPDLNPAAPANSAGISADGSEVLFTSASELTNDANTGETGGLANHQGSDLYSYNVASGELTDLTVDNNPDDATTGANVLRVFGASPDASYIYFSATGDLAPGAISGEENFYVEHEGAVDFISPAAGMILPGPGGSTSYEIYVTPNGAHAAFVSTESLTGYDNAGFREVYKYTYKDAIECASCRPSGAPPTGGASISAHGPVVGGTISDDGSRVFFQSADAILPEDVNGADGCALQKDGVTPFCQDVYEYEGGEAHLLSAGDGESPASLLGASASGDDVFITTYDALSPQVEGTVAAIYDARVNADVAQPVAPQCQGEGCRGASTSAPNTPGPGTPNFRAQQGIGVSRVKTVSAPKAQLRVIVPEGGELKASGKGLKAVRKLVSGQGSLTLTLALQPAANSKRLRKGVFKTKAELLFTSGAGDTSRAEVSLKFEASTTKKGGK